MDLNKPPWTAELDDLPLAEVVLDKVSTDRRVQVWWLQRGPDGHWKPPPVSEGGTWAGCWSWYPFFEFVVVCFCVSGFLMLYERNSIHICMCFVLIHPGICSVGNGLVKAGSYTLASTDQGPLHRQCLPIFLQPIWGPDSVFADVTWWQGHFCQNFRFLGNSQILPSVSNVDQTIFTSKQDIYELFPFGLCRSRTNRETCWSAPKLWGKRDTDIDPAGGCFYPS